MTGMATLRLAHRGDWRTAPENSLAAMEAALRIPACDGLEFDVRGSKDGVPILIHDPSLDRVQGVRAVPSQLTASECYEHGISGLGQVLSSVGCDPFLDIEFKEIVPGAIDVIELERGGAGEDGRSTLRNAVLSAFEPETLRWLAAECPTWPRWLNALALDTETLAVARDLGCEAVSVTWAFIDEAGVERASKAGLAVAGWTVRSLDDYRRLEALGVVAICAEAAALDG